MLVYMKAISLKLDEGQLRQLNKLSRGTGIPKSVLIRKGIDLVIRQAKEGAVSSDLRREVDSLIHEDRELLERLAKA